MWFFPTKKQIKLSLKKRDKSLNNLKVQIDKLDLDKKLSELELRLGKRIDNILVKILDKMVISNSSIKSKKSLKQVQESKVIQAFRQTKKQLAKEKILELQKTMPIPSIKIKLMQELGISKASFYNYLKELDNESNVQIVQKSK